MAEVLFGVYAIGFTISAIICWYMYAIISHQKLM